VPERNGKQNETEHNRTESGEGKGAPMRAQVQDGVGGHFGFVLPLVTHKAETGFFKAYFVADLPVRFNRPPGGPSANPVTFAMHFGLGF
jgi:hypothetical protein